MNEAGSGLRGRPASRQILAVVILFAIYFAIAIPFKAMTVIPGFTDVRPVMMLQPIYGIFYGTPGCLVLAVGNLISDILSDSLRWSSIAGFAANFLGPYLYYIFWTKLSRTPFDLRSGKNIIKYILQCFLIGLLQSVIITPFVAMFYPDVAHMTFGIMVFLNSSLFPILLGIPIMILMQEELGFRPLQRSSRRRKDK